MTDLAIKACLVAGTAFIALGMLKFLLGKGEETQAAQSFELVPKDRLFDHHEYAVVQVRAAQRRIVEVFDDPFAALEAMYRHRESSAHPEEWRLVNADEPSYGFLDPPHKRVRA